jgi:hypothetical protein
VGYNVQVAVDTERHLIVTHEVTNIGNDRSQLAGLARQTKETLETEGLDVVAARLANGTPMSIPVRGSPATA